MRNTTYKLDGGKDFGAGDDPVSELIYRSSAKEFLRNVPTAGKRIADYGGGNGILRRFLNAKAYKVVDVDETKKTSGDFICDDITTHRGSYDLVICRYVLHYLTDEEALQMFEQIRRNGTKKILIIQFVNEKTDLKIKREISERFEKGIEQKHFRTCKQLFDLFDGFSVENVDKIDYKVTPDFYRNRLGITGKTKPHKEQIYSVLLTPKIYV